MRFAIYGSEGFLGSRFCNHFKEQGMISGSDFFEKTRHTKMIELEKYNPDVVLYCVTTKDAKNVYEQYMQDSVILKFIHDHPNIQLVTYGTDCSYNENHKHSEENYSAGYPLEEWRHYAYQKRALLNVLRSDLNLNWYHFVLTSMFGPGFKLTDNHLMHDIIKKMIIFKDNPADKLMAIMGYTKIQFGNPSFLREVIYVDDVVKNTLACVKMEFGLHEVTNLGSVKKRATVQELVKTACKVLEIDYSLVFFDDSLKGGHPFKWLDNQKISDFLGTEYADISLDEGIKITAKYYRDMI